jgi:NADPH2:quinone reductase
MKAIRVHECGGPDVLQPEELPIPRPGDDEIVVQQEAIGVNYIDTYHRTGLYPLPLPFTPGQEGAGKVVDKGAKVSEFAVGDRVAYVAPGTYAEYVALPAQKAVRVPSALDARTAAALMLQGMTAHYLTKTTYPLKEGSICLVHAAAGGVGLLLVQMAKMAGARVYATVSTEEKARLARQAGADFIIMYTKQDFEQEIINDTNGRGVDVVYDSVGRTTFDKSLNCLRQLGYMVLFGQSSGKVDKIDPSMLAAKGSLFLTRTTLFHYIAERQQLESRANDLFAWVKSGKLNVRIGMECPLEEAATAHEQLEGRKTTGKVLLIP